MGGLSNKDIVLKFAVFSWASLIWNSGNLQILVLFFSGITIIHRTFNEQSTESNSTQLMRIK